MQINIVAVWHNNNICGATWHIQCHHVIEDHRIRGWNYSKYIFCFLLSMFRCICDRARDGRTSGDALAFFAFIHSFIDGEQNSKVSEIFNYILFLDFEWLFFSHFIYTFIYIPIHFITFEQSPWMRYFFLLFIFVSLCEWGVVWCSSRLDCHRAITFVERVYMYLTRLYTLMCVYECAYFCTYVLAPIVLCFSAWSSIWISLLIFSCYSYRIFICIHQYVLHIFFLLLF